MLLAICNSVSKKLVPVITSAAFLFLSFKTALIPPKKQERPWTWLSHAEKCTHCNNPLVTLKTFPIISLSLLNNNPLMFPVHKAALWRPAAWRSHRLLTLTQPHWTPNLLSLLQSDLTNALLSECSLIPTATTPTCSGKPSRGVEAHDYSMLYKDNTVKRHGQGRSNVRLYGVSPSVTYSPKGVVVSSGKSSSSESLSERGSPPPLSASCHGCGLQVTVPPLTVFIWQTELTRKPSPWETNSVWIGLV